MTVLFAIIVLYRLNGFYVSSNFLELMASKLTTTNKFNPIEEYGYDTDRSDERSTFIVQSSPTERYPCDVLSKILMVIPNVENS